MNYRKQKLSTKDINLFILNKINYHLKKKSNLYAYIHKIISFIVFFLAISLWRNHLCLDNGRMRSLKSSKNDL